MRHTMVALALALAILFPLGSSAAVYVAKDAAGTTVTMWDTPCANKKALRELPRLNKMLADANKKMGWKAYLPVKAGETLAATVVYDGKQYGACVAKVGLLAIVLDDAGAKNSIWPVPAADFKASVDM